MQIINFDNKTFSLIENSESGKVNTDTIFEYKQKEDLVTADYYGGSIIYGKIIARLENKKLHMMYQCLTTGGELKAGKAIASVSFTDENKILLSLNWQWLNENKEEGTSQYIEN